MPTAGFKKGDSVLTPGRHSATVTKVISRHPERVEVAYHDTSRGARVFNSNALRYAAPR